MPGLRIAPVLAAALAAWFTLVRPAPAAEPVADTQPAPATQPTTISDVPTELDAATLQARITQLESATDLDAAVQADAIAQYRLALDQLQLISTWNERVAEYVAGREQAPALLRELREQLSAATTRPAVAVEIPADADLDDLNQGLLREEATLRAAQENPTRLEEPGQRRAQRRDALPEQLAAVAQRLEVVTRALRAAPAAGGAAPLQAAQRAALEAQRRALEAEVRAYNEELRFYAARNEILAARREEARQAVTAAQARVTAWQQAVRDRRQAEIEEQQRQAEAERARAPRSMQELAEYNATLARERAELASKIEAAQAQIDEAVRLRGQLDGEYESLAQKLDTPGLAEYLGPELRRQRTRLAALRDYERAMAARRREAPQIAVRRSDREEARRALDHVEQEVQDVLARLQTEEPGLQASALEPTVRELFGTRRQLLDRLIADYDTYLTLLTTASTELAQVLREVAQFRDLVDRHFLWLPDMQPLPSTRPPREWSSLLANLGDVGAAVLSDMTQRAPEYGVPIVVVLLLMIVDRRLRSHERAAAERVTKVFTDSYRYTLQVMGLVVLGALPIPLLLWFFGGRVGEAVEGTTAGVYELGRALGLALRTAALSFLTLDLLRRICRPRGLAECHFRWDGERLRATRRYLWWLLVVLVPAALVIAATERHPEPWRDTVGRVTLLAAMIVLSLILQRLLHPRHGAFAGWLSRNEHGVTWSTRHLWYPWAVALPLLMAAASAWGYHNTALELLKRVSRSVWLMLGLLVLYSLLVRWLVATQRRLALEQARKRRAAQAAERAADADGGELPPLEESEISIGSIGEQTRRILRSFATFALVIALWFIWADMLPARGFMNDVRLWQYTAEVAAPTDADGATQVVRQLQFITLAHVALAAIISAATYVLARNIPGLLEIALLQRLPLDKGGRFAATTLARYVIVVVGTLAAFNAVGIGWTKVQWLVAAFSVGLGFGLQEIFANFVSGLILLFERPIRIGDTVTVGNVSGTVTRMEIRATTITDWDRKELIIPNKDFVTGQVINWTLSDPSLRVVIQVGVAYGSDTALVERVLLDVARAHPHVLDDPPPRVVFSGFGDSALNFELRTYIGTIDHIVAVRHELNKAIDAAFREAGIEIPFPQRDLHVRSIDVPLPGLAPRDQGAAGDGGGATP